MRHPFIRAILVGWLCMACCLIPAAVSAAPGDMTLFSPQSVDAGITEENMYGNNYAVLDGQIYMMSYVEDRRVITTWRPDMPKVETWMELPTAPEAEGQPLLEVEDLAAGDGRLLVLNYAEGRVGEIKDGVILWFDAALDVQQGASGTINEWEESRLQNPMVQEGVLYGLRSSYDQQKGEMVSRILCYDLETGAQHTIEVPGANTFCAYKPGQLLTVCAQENVAGDYSHTAYTLVAVDVATGTNQPLTLAMAPNNEEWGFLAYDRASDSIYYHWQGEIRRSVGAAPFETVAYYSATVNTYNENRAWVLGPSMLAMDSHGKFSVRNVDPQYKPERVLRIQGSYEDAAYFAFAAAHPEVQVLLIDYRYDGAEQIAQAITSGTDAADLYMVDSNMNFSALLDKGYAADLSASPALTAEVAGMYPQIQDALKDEKGVLRAYPQAFYMSPWQIDLPLWEKYGMGPVPTTYDAFLDAMLRWEQEHGHEEDPEIVFLNGFSDRESLIRMIISAYILQYETQDQPIDFTAPALRSALEKIEQLKADEEDREAWTDEQWQAYNEYINLPGLIYANGYMGNFYDPDTTQYISNEEDRIEQHVTHMLSPTFAEGEPSKIAANMSVFCVNPSSPNIDLALLYLENYTEGSDPELRYSLRPDLNEPMVRPNFEKEVEETKKYLANAQKQLEKADESEKIWLKDSIDYQTRWLAEQDKNKWLISQSALENYRAVASNMGLTTRSMFLGYEEGGAWSQMWELIERYRSNQMTLDAFLRELNNKMRMMFLEGQ